MTLQNDLQSAEAQYLGAFQSHLINVDSIIQIHAERLEALENYFDEDLKELQAEFDGEK